MAFKLVGDQVDGIKQIKKKRVSELLLNEIPDDEAHLMRDGRYACLVCAHRPVFDTVATLAIHRNGKRHVQASTRRARDQKICEALEMKKQLDCNRSKKEELLAKAEERSKKVSCSDPCCPPLSTGPDHSDDESTQSSKHSVYSESLLAGSKRKQSGEMFDIGKPTADYVFPWKHNVNKKPKRKKQSNVSPKPVNSKFTSLRSSGWIPNGDGTWHKDPDVEFDSDEEEPEPVH